MTVVAVLDYGFGNVRSAVRALDHVGATVELTADVGVVNRADGLVVPGVGAFAACISSLRAVHGDQMIDRHLAGGRGVLGICVGMQVMFERGLEDTPTEGLGQWPGVVDRIAAPVVPHVGWNVVRAGAGTRLLAGLDGARFYFVHSYAAHDIGQLGSERFRPPITSWTTYGRPFLAAVENGPLVATQFHPEKSGDAGLALLENWVRTL